MYSRAIVNGVTLCTPDSWDAAASAVEDLWGKSGHGISPSWTSLFQHLLHTALAAEALWDELLSPTLLKCIENTDCIITPPGLRSWAVFLAGLHDIGKASPGFQARQVFSRSRMSGRGLPFPAAASADHEAVGARVMCDLLQDPRIIQPPLTAELALEMACMAAGHHRQVSPADAAMISVRDTGGERWKMLRTELVMRLQQEVFSVGVAPDGLCTVPLWLWALLGGLIRTADWLSSGMEFAKTDAGAAAGELREVIAGYVHGKKWRPQASGEAPGFAELFGFAPRGVQNAAVSVAAEAMPGSLVLIEAPMGEGKTEAALYLADRWMRHGGQRGFYLAMPTHAVAQAVMARCRAYVARSGFAGGAPERLLGQDPARKADEGSADWFAGPHRGLLAPVAVGTIDQSLLALLDPRFCGVRLLGLAGRTVIFDEVHALDEWAGDLLVRLLPWLRRIGCGVVMLSATLPMAWREALFAAWHDEAAQKTAPLQSTGRYPRISWLDSSKKALRQRHVPATEKRQVKLRFVPDEPPQTIADIGAALADGGCAVWVLNTVERAQQVFRQVGHAAENLGIAVEIIHSRYPAAERRHLADHVLRCFGPDRTARPQRALLIATQIVEQGIDLDFDLLVSEIAPMDLLLQRLGRLHRHKAPRPQKLHRPQMWLIAPPKGSDENPDFGCSALVYPEALLQRTRQVLNGRKTVHLPDDIEPLIAAVYDAMTPHDAFGKDDLSRDEAVWQYRRRQWEQRMLCRETGLAVPDFSGPASVGLQTGAAAGNSRCAGVPATRGNRLPGVHMVCLFATQDGKVYADRTLQHHIDLQHLNAGQVQELVRSNGVTVHGQRFVRFCRSLRTPEQWRRVGGVARDAVPVLFDREGTCHGEGVVLRLDAKLGIVMEQVAKRVALL